jgi:Flp pilus assembly CpaE family ATPase
MVIVNRYQKGSPITREVVEETVGLPVAATVGNDFSGLSRSVNRGVLLWDEAPRSVVVRDTEALAALLAPGHRPAGSSPAATGWFLQKLLSPKAVAHGIG